MERWLEGCMTPTLIGVQKSVEEKINETHPTLPENFNIRHFNAVAGINDFEKVGLMISMGRSAPSPVDVENQIAAITGRDPQRLEHGEWFKRARAEIQLRDGSSVTVKCYAHPDPVVEAWRRHKHTSPVIQMLGRARPYNRTAATPLVMHALINEPLGILIDQVLDWDRDELEPMALVEPMACAGFVVLAPEVMCRLWPAVFESRRTAKRELQQLRDEDDVPAGRIKAILAGWRPFSLQKPGKGQKRRSGYYDPARFGSAEGLQGALEPALGPDLQLREG